jgi:flagellar protein FliO/FliZ
MESGSALVSISALLFVLALIGLTSFLMRKYGTERVSGGSSRKGKRLSVKEVKMLDAKNKLVIIERDDVEHLIVVGMNGAQVVESGFKEPLVDKDDGGNE